MVVQSYENIVIWQQIAESSRNMLVILAISLIKELPTSPQPLESVIWLFTLYIKVVQPCFWCWFREASSTDISQTEIANFRNILLDLNIFRAKVIDDLEIQISRSNLSPGYYYKIVCNKGLRPHRWVMLTSFDW